MDLRDKILAVEDLGSEVVFVPEWDCKVLVWGLDGTGRAKVLSEAIGPDGRYKHDKLYGPLLVATIRDPKTKELIFGDGDADELQKKSGAALERVARVATRLSGIGAEFVEEAEKNSPSSTPKSGSTSG